MGQVQGPVAPDFSDKPICAVPSKTDVMLEAVLGKPTSSRSLEEEFGVNPGGAATVTEYTNALIGGEKGSSNWVTMPVMCALELSLRRTEMVRIALLRSTADSNICFVTVGTSELCDESSRWAHTPRRGQEREPLFRRPRRQLEKQICAW